MSVFRALVVGASGDANWRVVDLPTERAVIASLVSEGLTPLEIRHGPRGLVERLQQPVVLGGRFSLADQALIMTQLALLIRAGLPVDRSLDLLREQAPRASRRRHLGDALTSVRGGDGLARAFERIDAFPDYVVGALRAAERSGRLGDTLATLADRMTRASSTRRHIITALTYPIAVLIATVAALALVLTIVVPQFQPIFAGQEAQLPMLTKSVIGLSDLITGSGGLVLLLTAAMLAIFAMLLRSPIATTFVDRYRNSIPGIGLRDQYLAGQFLGLLGMLIANGLTILVALPYAAGAISSQRWRKHLGDVERHIREGVSLSRAFASAPYIPRTAIRLIEVGERSGGLAGTCERASEILSEAARARIDRIVALVNPVAIVGLGGLVALLVAGVMLGIFSLGDFVG